MDKNLFGYRKSYEKGELLEGSLPNSPFELFEKWFSEVENAGGVEETNAMTISTIGKDGFPKSRVVLLKKFNEKGFVFYTNYDSNKGKAIANNPKVCLSFFWPNLERQVIIKGAANKLSVEDSESYFNKRPKGSQIGAWASPQSDIIDSREILEQNVDKYQEKFKNITVPKPPHWGGYIVEPISFEFWQGRKSRLHDRVLYEKEISIWSQKRLAP